MSQISRLKKNTSEISIFNGHGPLPPYLLLGFLGVFARNWRLQLQGSSKFAVFFCLLFAGVVLLIGTQILPPVAPKDVNFGH